MPLKDVILSEAMFSQSESIAQSKDPYKADQSFCFRAFSHRVGAKEKALRGTKI
jgi:hypothetical protein